MSVERNKALVRLLMEDDISRGDEAVAETIIHPEFVDHTNPPGMQHGLEGHKAIVRLFRAVFPDLEWRIDDLIAEGDKVVARTTMRGTQLGEFFGLPPTGESVEMSGVHILRIADGKIAEHWGNNDDLGLMRQLGAIPSPAEPAPV
jgi:predicted ester cyclase